MTTEITLIEKNYSRIFCKVEQLFGLGGGGKGGTVKFGLGKYIVIVYIGFSYLIIFSFSF